MSHQGHGRINKGVSARERFLGRLTGIKRLKYLLENSSDGDGTITAIGDLLYSHAAARCFFKLKIGGIRKSPTYNEVQL